MAVLAYAGTGINHHIRFNNRAVTYLHIFVDGGEITHFHIFAQPGIGIYVI